MTPQNVALVPIKAGPPAGGKTPGKNDQSKPAEAEVEPAFGQVYSRDESEKQGWHQEEIDPRSGEKTLSDHRNRTSGTAHNEYVETPKYEPESPVRMLPTKGSAKAEASVIPYDIVMPISSAVQVSEASASSAKIELEPAAPVTRTVDSARQLSVAEDLGRSAVSQPKGPPDPIKVPPLPGGNPGIESLPLQRFQDRGGRGGEAQVSEDTSSFPEEAPSRGRPAAETGDRATAAAVVARKSPAVAPKATPGIPVDSPGREISAVAGDLPEGLRLDSAIASRVDGSTGTAAAGLRAPTAAMAAVVVQIQTQGLALSDGRTIHIRLDPPDLGSFEVRLELRDTTARAVVATERADTLELLLRHRNELLSILRESGFDVEDAHFEQTGEGPISGSDDNDSMTAGEDVPENSLDAKGGGTSGPRESSLWHVASDRLDVRI